MKTRLSNQVSLNKSISFGYSLLADKTNEAYLSDISILLSTCNVK